MVILWRLRLGAWGFFPSPRSSPPLPPSISLLRPPLLCSFALFPPAALSCVKPALLYSHPAETRLTVYRRPSIYIKKLKLRSKSRSDVKYALRVPPAVTRLTVYRRLQVITERLCWSRGRTATIWSLGAVILIFLKI